MRPATFEYFDPRTIDEALDLLGKYGEEAKVLAGGLSLLPLMRFRLAAPGYIVDIGKIPGLAHIVESAEGGLRIGALTPYFTIETSSLVRTNCPVVAETAANIGDPQVRNRGTIGSSGSGACSLPISCSFRYWPSSCCREWCSSCRCRRS